MGVEARIGVEMARRALWVGPVVMAGAAVYGGGESALAAALGVLIVVGNFLLAGLALSWAANRSPNFLGVVALAGFPLRLALITGLVALAWNVGGVDPAGLAIGLGGSYLVLLVLQARREALR